jgi:hypothetical protein
MEKKKHTHTHTHTQGQERQATIFAKFSQQPIWFYFPATDDQELGVDRIINNTTKIPSINKVRQNLKLMAKRDEETLQSMR